MAGLFQFFKPKTNEDTSAEGPVQILAISGDQVVLNHDALKKILCHANVGKKPIAVISIVGAYRTGKSFLLNFILRYLRNKGYENRDWIGSYDEPSSGFAWRSGDESTTHGIWMWNKPIVVKKGQKEIAVFFADTEGHFDVNDTSGSNKISVILSMLLSSVMVFNVARIINTSDMKFLETCIEFSEKTNRGSKNNMFDLQALNFLVRDRPCQKHYSHGSEGGQRYRDEKIFGCSESSSSAQMTRIREKIQSSFDSIDCYLLPHPGLDVTEEAFSGCLRDDTNKNGFKEHLMTFCERIAHPENLVVKKNFTGRKLMTFLIRNFEAIEKNKDQYLDAKSYAQLQQETEVKESFIEAAAELGRKLDEVLKHGHVPTKMFEAKLKEIWKETGDEFRKTLISLGVESEQRVDQLKKYVTLMHFKKYRSANEIAKTGHGNIAETALLLTMKYENVMNEAMKDVHAHEWEEKLNKNHEVRIKEAKETFSALSRSQEYKGGLEFLSTSINCTKELMKLAGPLKEGAAEYKWKKLVWISIEEYRMLWERPPAQLSDLLRKLRAAVGWTEERLDDTAEKCTRAERHAIARQSALKYFDTHASEDLSEEARNQLMQCIQGISTQMESEHTFYYAMDHDEHVTKIRDEVRIFEYTQEVLKEIIAYSKNTQAVSHGDKFHKILARKKAKYAERAREIEQTLTASGTGLSLKEKILDMADTAFSAMEKRDKSLKPFHDRILLLDIKLRKLAFLSILGERLGGAYVLPDVLDGMHRIILAELLPKEDEDDEILHKHRKNVNGALDRQLEKFKVWNEDNKSIFKRVIGSVAGGLGLASGGVAGGAAAGLFFADIAIVTTVGAAVATGVGAAVVAGVLIVGGAIAAYSVLRKKAGNAHITEQMEKIESGRPDVEQQDEREMREALQELEDTEAN